MGITNFFKDGDTYPDWPGDLDESPSELSWWMTAVDSVKGFGMRIIRYRRLFHSSLLYMLMFYSQNKKPLHHDYLP